MWIAENWLDYELIDCTCGERLERWGKQFLIRPDPQVIWQTPRDNPLWEQAGGRYTRSSEGGGSWDKASLPEKWQIAYSLPAVNFSQKKDGVGGKKLTFSIRPMNFKHMGIFPEQAANWDWFYDILVRETQKRPVEVLNLFAYTGGATVAALAAGASVCHVDAARGMVAYGRENAALSGLDGAPVRWIVDDCVKFIQREIRRGKRYDAIIMDPPSYGRGPNGEVWKLEERLYPLVQLCMDALCEKPLLFLINSYTSFLSPSVAEYILGSTIKRRFGGHTVCGELGLRASHSGLVLPCGSSARWTRDKITC